ncbi:MAG: GatB/YqeY domain-containing protein, partial [Actinobacteria bacterium]|nr:GatB/YqeY domain-containing protein [Actinomycetota bacterium]
MSLKDKLKSDLTEAIRNRHEVKSSTIRMILTSITNEEVSGKEARTLSETEIITVLTREAKKRREAAEAFDQGGASERAQREREEGEIIATYLPAQLSDEELDTLIAEAISSTG